MLKKREFIVSNPKLTIKLQHWNWLYIFLENVFFLITKRIYEKFMDSIDNISEVISVEI